MGEVWIKEAEDLKAAGTSGAMEGGKPKVTWHVTVSPSGGRYFDAMHRVLVSKKAEPHILYDPVTDRLGQYFPLNRSARALGNDGSRRTNGSGTVNIQIEVVANTSPAFTSYWKPGPNFRALMRAIRSWGVPDVWPNPRLATGYGDNVGRSWATYQQAGHFGHCHVPGNDHWDPGPIDTAAIFRAAATPSPTKPSTPSKPAETPKEWFDMPISDADLDKIAERTALRTWQYRNPDVTTQDAYAILRAAGDTAKLAASVAAKLPQGAVSQDQLEAALKSVLGSLDAPK